MYRGQSFSSMVTVAEDYDPSTDSEIKDFNTTRIPTLIPGEGGKMGNVKETDTVVLRGLPYSTTANDVIQFFHGLHLQPTGVHLVNNEAGRPSGIPPSGVFLCSCRLQGSVMYSSIQRMTGERPWLTTISASAAGTLRYLSAARTRSLLNPSAKVHPA